MGALFRVARSCGRSERRGDEMRHGEAVDHDELLGTQRAALEAHAVAIAFPERDRAKEAQS